MATAAQRTAQRTAQREAREVTKALAQIYRNERWSLGGARRRTLQARRSIEAERAAGEAAARRGRMIGQAWSRPPPKRVVDWSRNLAPRGRGGGPGGARGVLRPDGTFTRTLHFALNQTYSARAAAAHQDYIEREADVAHLMRDEPGRPYGRTKGFRPWRSFRCCGWIRCPRRLRFGPLAGWRS